MHQIFIHSESRCGNAGFYLPAYFLIKNMSIINHLVKHFWEVRKETKGSKTLLLCEWRLRHHFEERLRNEALENSFLRRPGRKGRLRTLRFMFFMTT